MHFWLYSHLEVTVFGLQISQGLPLSYSTLTGSLFDIGHALHLKENLGGKEKSV